jgi:hypothetical protein
VPRPGPDGEPLGVLRIEVVPAAAYDDAVQALEALDDRLDDLPRYMAVTQPEGGWLPHHGEGPTMKACVYVDDVREMLRRSAHA